MRDARDIEFHPDPGKIAFAGVGIVLLIVVVLGVAGSFYSVPADSEGVVLRFGRWEKTTPPGLHGKIPFGVDRVAVVPLERIESMGFGFQTVKPGKRTEYRVTPEIRKRR